MTTELDGQGANTTPASNASAADQAVYVPGYGFQTPDQIANALKDGERRQAEPPPAAKRAPAAADIPPWAVKMLEDGKTVEEVGRMIDLDNERINNLFDSRIGQVADASRRVQSAESQAFASATLQYKRDGFSKAAIEQFLDTQPQVAESYHALRNTGKFREAIDYAWSQRLLSGRSEKQVDPRARNAAGLPEPRRGREEMPASSVDKPQISKELIDGLRVGGRERVLQYMREVRKGPNNPLRFTAEPPEGWEGS